MDVKLLFERMQRVANSVLHCQNPGLIRWCETKRIDGEFIRRRAEGALQRSTDGRVVVGVTLKDGLSFPFPTFLGAPYEEFEYLACEGQDLYLASFSFPDANGQVQFASRVLPLAAVAHIGLAWNEAGQTRKAA